MTRKSKRELERAVDGLNGGDGDDEPPEMILFQDPEMGVLRDGDGNVVSEEEADPLVIIETEADRS